MHVHAWTPRELPSRLIAIALLSLAFTVHAQERPQTDRPTAAPVDAWPSYGNDPGGQRFAPGRRITPANVGELEQAWEFHTGDVSDGTGDWASRTAFQATPILVDGTLFVCSPMNRVFAIDATSGKLRWSFDPELDRSGRYANQLICRGVSHWRDAQAAPEAACAARVLTATNDARLIALDARTGKPCAQFGQSGQIDLNPAAGKQRWHGEYQVTSPPAIAGDVVVVGSAVSDNARIDAPSGLVRGFDARTGAERWAWDLAPPSFERAPEKLSATGHALATPNVWAPMSVDPERDLVFLPTGNASPDYYHGDRADMNYYGSSVVALRASTGQLVWHFQTVHDDLWDFDVPAQPTLTTLTVDGRATPVVIQATKAGLLFVLHRETGKPVIPVEERPVPQGGALGERLSPTQPFPVRPPPLVSHALRPEDAWGITPWDRNRCREQLGALRFDGIYTPPTEQGTLMYPGNAGGMNWGGVAVHPERQLLIANSMNVAWAVHLIPRKDLAGERARHPGDEIGPQEGTPFAMRRYIVMSPLGVPCNPPPWGTLAAVDLARGEIVWQVPFGTIRDLAPVPLPPITLGLPGVGGPIVTASGLVFIGAAMDDYLRAFDLDTGEELWRGRLPAGGQATPMLYEIDGRPFIVIAAGGHARLGTKLGDAIVAFSLPR